MYSTTNSAASRPGSETRLTASAPASRCSTAARHDMAARDAMMDKGRAARLCVPVTCSQPQLCLEHNQ